MYEHTRVCYINSLYKFFSKNNNRVYLAMYFPLSDEILAIITTRDNKLDIVSCIPFVD